MKARLAFGSSHHNSDESVSLDVSLIVEDANHGAWRRSLTAPQRFGDVVQAANFSISDTDNPRYFLWNLAGTDSWTATIDHIIDRVSAIGGGESSMT